MYIFIYFIILGFKILLELQVPDVPSYINKSKRSQIPIHSPFLSLNNSFESFSPFQKSPIHYYFDLKEIDNLNNRMIHLFDREMIVKKEQTTQTEILLNHLNFSHDRNTNLNQENNLTYSLNDIEDESRRRENEYMNNENISIRNPPISFKQKYNFQIYPMKPDLSSNDLDTSKQFLKNNKNF